MRTWYGYDADGRLRSIESHVGGWSADADFNAPTSNETITRIVNSRREMGVVGFYLHDCPCKVELMSCSCHNNFVMNHYIEDGQLRQKPTSTLLIDDNPLAHQAHAAVGGTFAVQITADAPDGATVDLGAAYIDRQETRSLTLTSGKSEVVELPGSLFGPIRLGCWGKYVRSTTVTLHTRH